MIQRIDHVSLAVREPEKAFRFFTEILGAVPGTTATDLSKKYRWQILSLGDLSRIEILNPVGKGSFLDNFLKTKEGGVHHITLQTPDIRAAMKRLDEFGIPYFGYYEYVGAYWKEIFIHPKHAFGVLIQIAEFESDDWLAESEKFPQDQKYSLEKTDTGCRLKFAHPGGGKAEISLTHDEIHRLMDDLKHHV